MNDVMDMLQTDAAHMETRRQRNRERFPTAAELLDWANKHFPCTPGTQGHRITYARNAAGEEVGKQ